MDVDHVEQFRAQVSAWGVVVDASMERILLDYARLLSCYEEANVVGTRNFEAVVLEHVLDSLGCLLFGPLLSAKILVDVGSGAGLPGLPLRVVLPDVRLTVIEATGKKARFVRRAVDELGTAGVEVICDRAEVVGRSNAHRGKYDVAVARALAPLPVLAEYCVPLVREGGHVVAMKGDPDRREIEEGRRAARVLGARLDRVVRVPFLPESRIQKRCLVVLEKEKPTPDRYPRRTGVPKKAPLGLSEQK